MKKNILTLVGIALMTTTALLYSCNKEKNEIRNNVENEEILAKEANSYNGGGYVSAHFLYRTFINEHSQCSTHGTFFCGFNIDDILNGDETCWLMMYEKSQERGWLFYAPFEYLNANNAGELIDSARNGAITFYTDCELMSDKLVEQNGTDLIPAGRYAATLTTFKGEDAICIDFGTIL